MNELEINQSREKLRLESNIEIRKAKIQELEREIERDTNGLIMLSDNPAHYFDIREKTKKLLR